jgi:hypothetical protein
MPTATTTKEDSRSKLVQNHSHDFTKKHFSFLIFVLIFRRSQVGGCTPRPAQLGCGPRSAAPPRGIGAHTASGAFAMPGGIVLGPCPTVARRAVCAADSGADVWVNPFRRPFPSAVHGFLFFSDFSADSRPFVRAGARPSMRERGAVCEAVSRPRGRVNYPPGKVRSRRADFHGSGAEGRHGSAQGHGRRPWLKKGRSHSAATSRPCARPPQLPHRRSVTEGSPRVSQGRTNRPDSSPIL